MTDLLPSVEALAAQIPDGARIAVPPDYSYCANALWRAAIRKGVKNLHLIGVPVFGYHGDVLIGAGCVATVETSAVTLGENGLAPRFTAAVKEGRLRTLDATCPAIHAGLQAAERGAPFSAMRGLIGSDILVRRPDWRVIDNPFGANDPVVAIPALRPDFAVFHAPKADRHGNVWIGVRRECMLMAHAARDTLVTVEEFVDGDLTADPSMAAGTIPALYVTAMAEAKQGAWPQALPGHYDADQAHLARYAEMARTEDGFARYLSETVVGREAAE
ncbi:CoA-transferase [Thalassobaculum sp.]|uniref:CoA transferase subunit A n=1 Tax=Thalassobaculum sp. TaxID=2022740 RepID=UPI0032ECEEF6